MSNDIGFEIRANLASVNSPTPGSTIVLNQADGKLYSYDNNGNPQVISAALNNMAATIAPTSSNDSTQNYSTGSLWYIASSQSLYLCASATAGAAIWLLQYLGGSSPSTIQTKATVSDFGSSNFVTNSIIAPLPASSLTATTGSGFQYNAGVRASVTGSAYTYPVSSDTYDFAESSGSISHISVPNNSVQPTDPGAGVLFQKVVTNGTVITAITPINALGSSSALLIGSTTITTNGLPLISDNTSYTGVSYNLLPLTALSVTGGVTGRAIVFNGANYSSGLVSISGIDASTANANQLLASNGTNWIAVNGLVGAAVSTAIQTLSNASPSLQAFDSTAAGWTQQLPASASCPGKVFLFSHYKGSNNIVIAIGTGSGDTVYGVASSRLTLALNGVLGVIADGVNGWHAFSSAAIF